MKSQHKGFTRILYAFKYSFDGLVATFKSEAAFRQDILLCALAIVAQCFLTVPFYSRVIMIGSLFLIPLAELVNTALETIIDRIGPEKHPLSKKAKDIGSAIVMLIIVAVCVLWGALIWAAYK